MKGIHGELGEIFDDSSVPEDMKESILEQILDEAEKSAGTAPGHLQRYIDAIKEKTNRNWRMLVRGAGNSSRIRLDRSWFHIHKRKPWIAPGKFVFTEPRGMVMVDTSGSIGQEEMAAFIRELNNLSSQVQIDMGFIDAQWDPDNIPGQYIKDVKEGKAWKYQPVGGGGTAFVGFYEFMKKHHGKYDFCIILTDGFTCDSPLVPYKLARANYALMTPNHSEDWVKQAIEHGFKVAVIDDSIRREQERKRQLIGQI
jgi:predicted metal-dependent peptidase